MDRGMTVTQVMSHASLLDHACFLAVFVQQIKQFHRSAVQCRVFEHAFSVINKLQRKERTFLLQQQKKDLISFPEVQIPHILLIYPFQFAFIAGDRFAADPVGRK